MISPLSPATSTPESRALEADQAIRLLTERITQESPPGIGRWQIAWDMVEGASEALFRAEKAYIKGTIHRESFLQSLNDLLEAWRSAIRLFERDVQGKDRVP